MSKKVTYEPMGSHITVLLPHVKDTTESGIVKSPEMLEAERSKFTGALKVFHKGPNVPQIEVGCKVLLGSNAMLTPITIDGLDLMQVDAYQVLGIIHN